MTVGPMHTYVPCPRDSSAGREQNISLRLPSLFFPSLLFFFFSFLFLPAQLYVCADRTPPPWTQRALQRKRRAMIDLLANAHILRPESMPCHTFQCPRHRLIVHHQPSAAHLCAHFACPADRCDVSTLPFRKLDTCADEHHRTFQQMAGVHPNFGSISTNKFDDSALKGAVPADL